MTWDGSFLATLAVSGGAAFVVALAGGLLTKTGTWYQALRKPSWKPPDWAFGPIWTVILVLAAVSAALAWDGAATERERGLVFAALVLNSILNILWSGIFFRLRRPDWAFAEVLALWASILGLIVVFARSSSLAAIFLIPYLVWVTIAAVLNYRIMRLNRPFGVENA